MYAICFNSEQISKIYFAKENLADGDYHRSERHINNAQK